eukprot:gene10712-11890_t
MGGRHTKVADYQIVVAQSASEQTSNSLYSAIPSPASEKMKPTSKLSERGSSRPHSAKKTKQSSRPRTAHATFPAPPSPPPGPSSFGKLQRRASELPGFLQKSASQIEASTQEKRIANFQKRFALRSSADHPWLLKKARISNASIKFVEFGPTLGQGYMGSVKLCNIAATAKAPKLYFAMKCLPKEVVYRRQRTEKHVENERMVLAALSSPFCMQFFGCLEDKDNFYLALEYVPGGDLHHYLHSQKPAKLSNDVTRFFAAELFAALEHMHRSGFVYRDCKPENIGIDETGHVKLLDMGFATRYRSPHKLQTLCGTPAYLSPEQLDGKLTNGYSEVVDWWAFGVVIFELLIGYTPFARSVNDSAYEIFLRIMKKKISFPRSIPPAARNLIGALCHPKVEERLTGMEEIKQHAFFSVPWSAVYERRLVPPFIPHLEKAGDYHYFEGF